MIAAIVTPLPASTSVRCRLRRCGCQAAGLRRIWDEGRPAEEVLDQIGAVRAALRGVAAAIVPDSADRRMRAALDTADQADGLDDVPALVDRPMPCR